jgi:hypothetical protein
MRDYMGIIIKEENVCDSLPSYDHRSISDGIEQKIFLKSHPLKSFFEAVWGALNSGPCTCKALPLEQSMLSHTIMFPLFPVWKSLFNLIHLINSFIKRRKHMHSLSNPSGFVQSSHFSEVFWDTTIPTRWMT